MQNHPYRVKWEWFIILLAIWNSITLPIEIAFETDFFQATYTQVGNHIIDGFFILDIILIIILLFISFNYSPYHAHCKLAVVGNLTRT